ncbi:mucin-5AC-like isoform X3 [Biomphalaria pfeifferi]|uniref:Mucin-5AC-like isoform X3 n=1 Tax=Biomphalaria pfeifferi TaxID=112525 RepID=A0AAD8FFC2_BIOPF|nr:mucin-5AC-like isoform X3 [Biomphalaria pfeifferi]
MVEEEKHFNPITLDSHYHHNHFYHSLQHKHNDVYQQHEQGRSITSIFSQSLFTVSPSASPCQSVVLAETPEWRFLPSLSRKTLALFLISIILISTCCDARSVLDHQGQHKSNRVERSLPSKTSPSTTSHSTNVFDFTSVSSSGNSSSNSASTSSSDIPVVSHPPPTDSSEKSQLISNLITTLEQLHVLDGSKHSCYRVSKIVRRNSELSNAPSGNLVGFFDVDIIIEKVALSEGNVSKESSPQNRSARTQSVCLIDPMIELLSDTTRSGPVGVSNSGGGSSGIGSLNQNVASATGDKAASVDPRNTYNDDDDTRNGLSRTQIVVISTCSAIIGMFFLVAAFLRVRNYIKRAKMEQALANRPKFRSCSVALRNPTQSMEQLRRDSSASKTSHQNSITTKGSNGSQTNGSSRDNSSASSPRHEPDTAPLLIITRPADLSTSAGSNSSLQYIDEVSQAAKKKVQFYRGHEAIVAPPVSIVKNGGTEECYVVSLRQTQLGHVPISLIERSDSLKGRNHIGIERGSSLKSRPNPRSNMERRTSLKIIMSAPPDNGKDVVKPVKLNGQILRGKEGANYPKVNDEAQIYQLMRNPDILKAERCKAFFIHPRRNGSWERSLGRTKGYQVVSTEEDAKEYDRQISADSDSTSTSIKPDTVNAEVTEIALTNGISSERAPENSESKIPINRQCEPQGLLSDSSVAQALTSGSVSGHRRENIDLNLVSPLTESSYFGLSQSDVSLSSATNQGNEYFGQSEYHPDDEMVVKPSRDVSVDSSCEEKLKPSFPEDNQGLHGGEFINMAFTPTTPQDPSTNTGYPDFPTTVNESSSLPDCAADAEARQSVPEKSASPNEDYPTNDDEDLKTHIPSPFSSIKQMKSLVKSQKPEDQVLLDKL